VVAEVVAANAFDSVGTYDEAAAVDGWARETARRACAQRAG
jgi:hypothetical protein